MWPMLMSWGLFGGILIRIVKGVRRARPSSYATSLLKYTPSTCEDLGIFFFKNQYNLVI